MSFNQLDMLYRQVIMDHYKNPRNRGVIENGVSIDLNNPTCGDSLRLQLQIEEDRVVDAKFEGEGCSISLASASMMTQLVKGKSVEEALALAEIFSNMVQGKDYDTETFDLGDIEALSGVSKFPARIKCATLAWKALEKGVDADE